MRRSKEGLSIVYTLSKADRDLLLNDDPSLIHKIVTSPDGPDTLTISFSPMNFNFIMQIETLILDSGGVIKGPKLLDPVE